MSVSVARWRLSSRMGAPPRLRSGECNRDGPRAGWLRRRMMWPWAGGPAEALHCAKFRVSTPHHCMEVAPGVKVAGIIAEAPEVGMLGFAVARRAPRPAEGENSMPPSSRPAQVGRWSDSALRVLRERYLVREGGEVVETPEEMCWRVASAIAAAEERFGSSPAAVAEVAAAFYGVMVEGYFLPNS